MTGIMSSVVTGRDRDCLGCRIVSGGGLIGSGLYVTHHTRRLQGNANKIVMYSIATALVLLGTTRLLNLQPFRDKFDHK